MPALLTQSDEHRRREAAHARERQDAERGWERERRAVMWQCVMLSFTGVPIYGFSFHLTDGRVAQVAVTAAFFVSYACPLVRWLIYHLKCVSRDDY